MLGVGLLKKQIIWDLKISEFYENRKTVVQGV